jgi:hypothetical protein
MSSPADRPLSPQAKVAIVLGLALLTWAPVLAVALIWLR